MFKKILCCILCAAMLSTLIPVFADAQEQDICYYKVRIDAGEGFYIEKTIMEEDELYIPAVNFSRYTRYRFDSESMTFLVKGQEADKAFKKVVISPERKIAYVQSTVSATVVELKNCYTVEGELYLPFCQMLPILNAEIMTADPGLTGSILIANNKMSMAELLYDFKLQNYSYNLAEEFYNKKGLLVAYTIPSYLFDSVTDFRFDRLDVIFDSGTYNDYKEIFSDYLKDDDLYVKATTETDDVRTILDVVTGLNDKTEKYYDFFDWFDKLEEQNIKLPKDTLVEIMSSGDKYDVFQDDFIAITTIAHADDMGITLAEMMEGLDYIYTYLNHVEDNQKMLDVVYDISTGGDNKDAQYRAAKTIYDLYEGEILVATAEYFTKEGVEKMLKESAKGKTFLVYSLTAKVGGEIMEAVMPGDASDVSSLTLHAGIVNNAMLKAGGAELDTEESTESFRLSLLLMMLASRECYKIMAETAEGYKQNAADYRAKIEKLENMIMGLYRVAENVRFDTFENYESIDCRNRELLEEAGIFRNPEKIETGDLIEIDHAVYMDYLRKHPEYQYYALLDVNQDGVMELLATDTLEISADRYDDLIVYKNGELVLGAHIWDKYMPIAYDSKNLWLESQDGGTGYGMIFHYLDEDLTVRETSFYRSNVGGESYINNILVTDEILQDAYDDLCDKWREGESSEIIFSPVP